MNSTAMACPRYPFTEEEAARAWDVWGCNCGPTALAFALQISLDKVRPLIPGFEQKRYTSPSMMRAALDLVKVPVGAVWRPTTDKMFEAATFVSRIALCRIQWTGPWTAPGANAKWAMRQTHWIATWTERGVPLVFDCNGGIRGIDGWEQEIVPKITAMYDRADGGWFPAQIWRLGALPKPDMV